jgi:predicted regulator of Ras-like GTPase activity (Roadblock/LC7/MglB family)
MSRTVNPADLAWLLDDLITRVAEAQEAVVLSGDGLLMAASRGLTRGDAEYLAAVASGFQSLAGGAARRFGGRVVRQTMIEMETALLFVTSAGPNACLAVLSSVESDIGFIAYEMAILVQRVGQYLSAAERAAPDQSTGGA